MKPKKLRRSLEPVTVRVSVTAFGRSGNSLESTLRLLGRRRRRHSQGGIVNAAPDELWRVSRRSLPDARGDDKFGAPANTHTDTATSCASEWARANWCLWWGSIGIAANKSKIKRRDNLENLRAGATRARRPSEFIIFLAPSRPPPPPPPSRLGQVVRPRVRLRPNSRAPNGFRALASARVSLTSSACVISASERGRLLLRPS